MLRLSGAGLFILIAITVVGCVVKIPFVHGLANPNGPDYTTNYTSPRYVPIMFRMDGNRNVFAAWRGRVLSLNRNATIYYFRPRVAKITDSSLNAQVRDIWAHTKAELPKGDLDILILRCMPHNPTMLVYNYVFVKDSKKKWTRVVDDDYLNRIIESQI